MNEIHICGDMNLDSLDDNWLKSNYYLWSLSKMVQSACQKGNLSQIMKIPTQFQHNSCLKTTSISCLDHVYTNARFRCSEVKAIPFGNSDHVLLRSLPFSPVPSRSRAPGHSSSRGQTFHEEGNTDCYTYNVL